MRHVHSLRNDIKAISNQLQKHLDKIYEHKTAVQDKLSEMCTKRRSEADELKKRINEELESYFVQEDARIQEAVKITQENINNKNTREVTEAIMKAKTALLVLQSYEIFELDNYNEDENDDNEEDENIQGSTL